MNKQRLFILIAAAVGMVSAFLPWVTMPLVGSVNGMQGNAGWVVLALFALPLVISLLGDRSQSLSGPMLYTGVLTSLGAAIYGIWKIKDFKSAMSGIDTSNVFGEAISNSVSIGIGLYLIVAAGLLIPVLAFAIKDKAPVASMENNPM